MDLLLDTHMALWFMDGSSLIPRRAIEEISDVRNTVFVSDVSAWEIAIKHAKRPDVMPKSAEEFSRRCRVTGFAQLPLDLDAIFAYENLDCSAAAGVHRGPFDRMLIAQAKSVNMLLVTHDQKLALYHEPHVAMY